MSRAVLFRVASVCLASSSLAGGALSDFVPGRIYVTKSNPECGLGGLYTAGGVSAIDLSTGKATLLGTFPPQPISSGWGKGIAVYVPEPPSVRSFLTLVWVLVSKRFRR